jgi:molecular chaperone GrpE (heat shock protein)
MLMERPSETAGDADVVSVDERSDPGSLLDELPVESAAASADDLAPETSISDKPEAQAEESEAALHVEPSIEPYEEAFADLRTAVVGLDSRLEESQRLLGRQSDLVDRLHTENQELRAGELRTAQLPLIRDLLRLHDDVSRMRVAAGELDEDLRVVQESLLDILARNGVESFAPEDGDEFDPRFHAAAGIEPTADRSLDKSVAVVVKRGFRWDCGDVIRVAEVRAFRYRDTA